MQAVEERACDQSDPAEAIDIFVGSRESLAIGLLTKEIRAIASAINSGHGPDLQSATEIVRARMNAVLEQQLLLEKSRRVLEQCLDAIENGPVAS